MGHSPDNPPEAPPSGASGELTVIHLLDGQWRWLSVPWKR